MAPISLVRKYERSNARKCEGGFTYSPRTPQAAVAVPQGDDSSTHRDDDAVTTDSGTYGRSPSREHSEEIAGTEVHDGDGDLLSLPWTTEEDDLLKELKKIEEDFTFEKIASMFCRFAGLPKTSSEYRGEIHKRAATECAQRWDDLQTPVESLIEEFESPAPAQAAKKRSRMTRESAGTVAANPVKKKKTTPKVTNEKKKTPKATGKKVPWTHDEGSYLEKLYRDKGNMSEGDFEKYASRKISARSKNKRTQYAVRHRMNETNLKKLKKHCKLPNGRRVSRSSGRNWTPSEESTLRSLVKKNRETGRPEYEGVPELLERKFGHLRTTDACKQHFRKIENEDDASEVTNEAESESQLLTENTENEGSLNEPMQQERPPLQSLEHEIRMVRLRHAHGREMAQMLYEQEKEMTELLHKQSLTTH